MASPELQAVIDLLRGRPAPRVDTPEGLAAYRQGFVAMTADQPLPPDVAVRPVDAGGVPGEWLEPAEATQGPILLFLHGGAYVRGSPATHRALVAALCRAAGVRALTLDYRLGPEHRFPAALEDAVAAWRWLLEHSGEPPGRLALAGDSAGGGLSLATLVALRDAGDPLPAAAALLSPWTDLAHTGASITERAAADPFVDRAYLETMAACYLGGHDPRDPLASPLYADLCGLPPLLIQVGTAEILLDDSVRVAEAVRRCGGSVTLEQWPDMVHVWHLFAPMLPEGRAGIEQAAAWLRRYVHRPGTAID